MFTQGRFQDIGFVGNVQEYSKLTNSMRNNSTHLIIFEMRTDDERKAIAKDYPVMKEKINDMQALTKHRCYFLTQKKVIVYEPDGREKIVEGGMWRGKVLPPLNVHYGHGE